MYIHKYMCMCIHTVNSEVVKYIILVYCTCNVPHMIASVTGTPCGVMCLGLDGETILQYHTGAKHTN